jgi:hypothetical protein
MTRPIVPEDVRNGHARRDRSVVSLTVAVLASARGTFDSNRTGAAERIVRANWPSDRTALG